ncbi:16S rRNA (cytidine(1402)-2'-O)-methyltransferase [Thiomicrospira cyclica]|uniref:Ribosomal RNA small subunit methyltransferase I n=1 Tax=Thiomicrospira cyclica (strain DSM 14477 / JCM 11371 / ALM1) TaxID=717773 RepID=F6D9R8_THICA|nr:16S rRNA (cytidine(1402)-2'-O)-methyltransferase [Thiomicrospira cyclica]AEG32117.1 Ribosomal RNA small subunit methyltransferase I [Thiomicrospira cyclica ALM1]
MELLEKSTLYVVATPLGNLADISQRALTVLAQADWIAAEDTRHSQKLLTHFGINNRLISLHNYNERARIEMLQTRLALGEVGAIISDAGTPLISDPGYHLVNALRQAGLQVRPVPGPSAMIAALSVSGIATDRFYFEGFLPAKSAKRLTRLKELSQVEATLVFYEAPHRLIACLEDLSLAMGPERLVCVAREMTKQYEEFLKGTLAEVQDYFAQQPDKVRGELVLVVDGAQASQTDDQAWQTLVMAMLTQQVSVKTVAEVVAEHYQLPKKTVYQWAQSAKNQMD